MRELKFVDRQRMNDDPSYKEGAVSGMITALAAGAVVGAAGFVIRKMKSVCNDDCIADSFDDLLEFDEEPDDVLTDSSDSTSIEEEDTGDLMETPDYPE